MKIFLPKDAIATSCWCQKCRKETWHQVHGGRPHACEECIKRLQNPTIPGIVEPVAEQIEMFKKGRRSAVLEIRKG